MKWLAVSACVLVSARAWADDPKKDSLTVLPWTDASLAFSSEEKVANVAYSQPLSDDFSIYIKGSAPIDEDTRTAAFATDGHFASGISANVQAGYDGRVAQLAKFKRELILVNEYVNKALSPNDISIDHRLEEAYVQSIPGLSADNDAVSRHLCRAAQDPLDASQDCTRDKVRVAVCKTIAADGKPCSTMTEADAAAVRMLLNCAPPKPGKADQRPVEQCYLAQFWLRTRYQDVASYAVIEFVTRTEEIETLWAAFARADETKAKALNDSYNRNHALALVADGSTVLATLSAWRAKAPFERRDTLLTATPLTGGTSAFLLDISASYDRLSVYHDDLAADPKTEQKIELEIGADYTYYARTPGLAFDVRVGLDHTRDPGAKKTERCVSRASTDGTITGESCKDELFIAGDPASAKTSAYARLAATYQWQGKRSEDDLIPGVEARLGVEGLFQDKSLEGRLTLFGTPVSGTAAARVGIALDATYDINRTDRDTPRWNVTPLVFVGATFSGLMGSHQ
ncbi:MAG: hypothetical protein HOV81_45905 [Kofleriaceae bacterium]|nr:hypothetical protein [Kofleriaceae bacterium]